ncbi:hypothetical protein [Chromobacterium vaccinii]|uniref:hypothetical protein n=1 Tax=Chromobacterium vaccinii TaxID=1108595 RepID=UPI000AF70569|nr:hypothetical protein [Chromobacterium vaccinii]QND85818.1 Uncharacterized protein ChrSW_3592 [Chromobacterium vaccinii]QND91049.1 Uncharacterized protein ChrSV_3592 [Chromobacterium vaccinii]
MALFPVMMNVLMGSTVGRPFRSREARKSAIDIENTAKAIIPEKQIGLSANRI